MVSFPAYCVLFTYYTFYRLRDWGPPKCWGPLAVAQSATPLIRHCSGNILRSIAYEWLSAHVIHTMLLIKIRFWHNLFLTLLNATTAYTVTNSDLWHYAEPELTCCTCADLHKVPISSTSLLYFIDPWRAVVVDYSSRFVNVVRTVKSRSY